MLPAVAVFLAITLATAGFLWFGKKKKREPALHKSEWRRFPLVKKTVINHNTALYRFKLPKDDMPLGLPIGQHISAMALIDGKEVMRSYTPTSSELDLGFFELLIKSYPTGVLSKWFSTLTVGDLVNFRGPKGAFVYTPNTWTELGMIAGGTGITPMLQIIRAILHDPSDKTAVSLIFANVNEDDILLKNELDSLFAQRENFRIYYVLNNPPNNWLGGVGFVTKDMISERLPKPSSSTKILLCGPPPMVKAMQQHCEEIGFEKARVVSKLEDQIFKF